VSDNDSSVWRPPTARCPPAPRRPGRRAAPGRIWGLVAWQAADRGLAYWCVC